MAEVSTNEIPETEIVQFPAIVKNNTVLISGPSIAGLSRQELIGMASLMGGNVAYIKMRATYTTLETSLCGGYECYRPVEKGSLKCSSHKDK